MINEKNLEANKTTLGNPNWTDRDSCDSLSTFFIKKIVSILFVTPRKMAQSMISFEILVNS